MTKVKQLHQEILAELNDSLMPQHQAAAVARLVSGLIGAVREESAAHVARVADGVATHEPATASHREVADALRVMAEHLRGLAVGE